MSSVVTIESRFITIREGFIQEIGVDFRGLGGSGPGTEAFLNDVTFGLEDNAGTAADNSGPGLATGAGLNPVAGAFFNDGSNGDVNPGDLIFSLATTVGASPPCGNIVLIVFWVLEGTPGDNAYGPKPVA